MIQLNRMPTYQDPLDPKGVTSRTWYSFWTGLLKGQPTGPAAAVVVGPSPFSYVAPSGGTLVLSGGTTTQVRISRDGANYFVTGLTAGLFPMAQGDTLEITYTVGAPTATFLPR